MKGKAIARGVLEQIIGHYGYSLKIDGNPPRGFANFFKYIIRTGFQPKTVFDVGVGNGTPWLYEAFPKVHFVLIEPQMEFETSLKRICKQMDAEYHLVGAGETESDLPLYRLSNSPTGSSFLPPSEQAKNIWGTFNQSEEKTHIVQLDTYKDQLDPFLLKIDTEGYELKVLQGAARILAKTDLVLMEVAIAERQVGEADLIEIGMCMKKNGFRLIDIPMLTQQSVHGPLLYVDVAFARIGGSADVVAS